MEKVIKGGVSFQCLTENKKERSTPPWGRVSPVRKSSQELPMSFGGSSTAEGPGIHSGCLGGGDNGVLREGKIGTDQGH